MAIKAEQQRERIERGHAGMIVCANCRRQWHGPPEATGEALHVEQTQLTWLPRRGFLKNPAVALNFASPALQASNALLNTVYVSQSFLLETPAAFSLWNFSRALLYKARRNPSCLLGRGTAGDEPDALYTNESWSEHAYSPRRDCQVAWGPPVIIGAQHELVAVALLCF